MIRRANSATAVSSACPAKNTIAVSMMANTSARNGAATMREFDRGGAVLLADQTGARCGRVSTRRAPFASFCF